MKGRIDLQSEIGHGSTFSLILPITFHGEELEFSSEGQLKQQTEADAAINILCVEDSEEYIHVYGKYLRNTLFRLIPVKTLFQAQRALEKTTPSAIILDINLNGEDSWTFIADLKNSERTSSIPIIVISIVDDPRKALSLGAAAVAVKPVEQTWLIDKLQALTKPSIPKKILIVDDDDAFRHTVKAQLEPKGYQILESRNGTDALDQVSVKSPDVVLLDIGLSGLTGFSVAQQLRISEGSRNLAIVLTSSKELDPKGQNFVESHKLLFISKDEILRSDRETNLERVLLSQIALTKSER